MVASLLDLAGLDWPVPDFTTLCRRQKTLIVHIPYRPSTGTLHLLIDSTGVKAEGDGEWLAKKHGPSKRSRGTGARFTSGSMRKRWKSGPSRSPEAGAAMRPYCPTCWTKSQTASASA